MSCLGFLVRSCGLQERDILNVGFPSHVRYWLLNKIPRWLLKDPDDSFIVYDKFDSDISLNLAEINNDPDTSDSEREAKFTEIFKSQGVEVKFV